MKTFLGLLLLACTFVVPMNTQAQSKPGAIVAGELNWKNPQGGQLPYLLYVPPEYATAPQQRWPLLLFLHGAGERGTDVQRVGIHGPLSLVRQGTNFPFIIVAPQCPPNQIWDNEPLLQLLARMTADYRVDTNRVYLTGLSMGGYGTWKLGLSYPEKFAAIAPICGGANMIDVILGSWDRKAEMEKLPIWAFHGAKDDVVPLSESERVVEGLKKAGHKNIQFTVYPEAKHDSWKLAYADPKFYEWLLKQSR